MRFVIVLIALGLLTAGVACSDDDAGTTTPAFDAGQDTQEDTTSGSNDAANSPDTAVGTDTALDAVADAAPSSQGWSTLAPMPEPRQETSVVALGDEVWVLGGFDDTAATVPTVDVYTPSSNTWRKAADLPVPMHHSNAAVVDGKIYVTGFLVGIQFITDGRTYAYDPATDIWSEKASMPAGTERGGSGVAAIGGKIYVAGGLRRIATREFSAYDPATDTWETLPDLPSPRDHMAATAINDLFVMVGGRNTSIGSHTTRVDVYNPQTALWSPRTEMPSSRGGVAAAALDGRFYIFGGEGNPDDATGVFGNTEVYDLAADTWTILDPMPVPRHGNGAATVGNTIYIPGGADVQAFGAVATVEAYTP